MMSIYAVHMLLGHSCHQYPLLIVAMHHYHHALGSGRTYFPHQPGKSVWCNHPPSWEHMPLVLPPPPDPPPSLVFPSVALLFPTASPLNCYVGEQREREYNRQPLHFNWSCLSSPSSLPSFPVTIDSSTTITIAPYQHDFVSFTKTEDAVLQGLATGYEIHGEGFVHWGLTSADGTLTTLQVPAYLVPSAHCCMLSPQSYLQSKVNPACSDECLVIKATTLEYVTGSKTISIPYSKDNNLPVIFMCNEPHKEISLHACVTQEQNTNLTATQKELMCWHY